MSNKLMKKIIIAALIIAIPINKCYAFSNINIDYVSSGTNENPWDDDGDGIPTYNKSWGDPTNSNINYSCKVDYRVTVTGGDIVYGYDKYNQEMMQTESETTKTGVPIIAGTAVGLRIEESKTITWEITNILVTKTEKTNQYPCNCEKYDSNCNGALFMNISRFGPFKMPLLVVQKPICIPKKCNYGEPGCTCKWCGGGTNTTYITSGTLADYCKTEAIKEQITTHANSYKGSNYTLKIRDSNDIETKGAILELGGKGGCSEENPSTCTYTYGPKTVCMNIKNSKVRYSDTDENCTNEEMKIENDIVGQLEHWHYFIPLNTKTTDSVTLTMSYASQKDAMPGDYCVQQIERNPTTYRAFIRDNNNEKLPDDIERAKALVKKEGCYFGNEIELVTTQKFYNEVNNGESFKGFNFYYRPIDVNNPFPNGLATTSLWQNVTTNFTGPSDDEQITYRADNIDSQKIRDYANEETNGKKNTYTSWENMHMDGKSGFIEEGYVKRTEDIDFYKLGCGPSNEKQYNSDGTINHLYQMECGDTE